MRRRDFIITTGLASLSFSINNKGKELNVITADDLQKFLRNLYPVREPSVDRIIIGDPGTKIKKVGTAWTPYFKTLKYAVSQGINVLIVHEPTFYRHWDLDVKGQELFDTPSIAKGQYLEALETKKKWIESNGLVIIRSHDVPDIIKNFGIPFGLGLKLRIINQIVFSGLIWVIRKKPC